MKKITIEIEIDKKDGFVDYTDELADKIQKNIIKSVSKTMKWYNFFNMDKIKLISLKYNIEYGD